MLSGVHECLQEKFSSGKYEDLSIVDFECLTLKPVRLEEPSPLLAEKIKWLLDLTNYCDFHIE
jgi:hypothetical protein